MRTGKKTTIVIFTWLIVLTAFMLFGCSSDDSECECNGQFYNPTENKYLYECGNETTHEGYYFVECVTEPEY